MMIRSISAHLYLCTLVGTLCFASACGTDDDEASGCSANNECTEAGLSICDTDNGECVQCLANADCGQFEACDAATNSCVDERPSCTASSECPAEYPSCLVNSAGQGTCTRYDVCTGDESGTDDGPNAAQAVTLEAGSAVVIENQGICNNPESESDWYRMTVADGDHVKVTVTADDGVSDLDITFQSSDGQIYGLSWWQRPESVMVTYLPAGDYFAVVALYSDDTVTAAAAYSIAFELTTGNSCSDAADCAAEYDTQYYRGDCNAQGSCQQIVGNYELGEGEPCDSDNDCASPYCVYGQYDFYSLQTNIGMINTADAHLRGVCTKVCESDSDCAASTGLCSTNFVDDPDPGVDPERNFCVAPCTQNDHCPILDFIQPQSGAWTHLLCDVPTGTCLEFFPELGSASGGDTSLLIDTVSIDAPGWLVAFADDAGSPGAMAGTPTYLAGGIYSDAVIDLGRPLASEEVLHVGVFYDSDGDASFDSAVDQAVSVGGAALVTTFTAPVIITEGALSVSAQTLTDLSTMVLTDLVTLPADGWLVVHEDAAGAPGTVLGVVAMATGTAADVAVTLSRPLSAAEPLLWAIYEDMGTLGTWEPGVDLAFETSGSVAITAAADVTVAAGVPAVRLEVGTSGLAYVVNSVTPADYATMVGPEATNPTLTFNSDWRYAISNSATGGHPFELMAGATVLLSQSAVGSLEADGGVNWDESTVANEFSFTAVAALTDVADAYRCSIHTTAMTNSISFVTP